MTGEERAEARRRMIRKTRNNAWQSVACGVVMLAVAEHYDALWWVLFATLMFATAAIGVFTRAVIATMPDDVFDLFHENHRRLWRGQPLKRRDDR